MKKRQTKDPVQLIHETLEELSDGTKAREELSARERIVLAALDELEEVGFARFSLRRVASRCGVSCAAPYKHFKNKREIIEAILRHINSDWSRRQEIVLNEYADRSIRERLVEISLEFIRFMVENPQFRSIMMISSETFDSNYLQIKADLSARSKELIREYCVSVGMPAKVARAKMYIVRSLLYGAALMFGNCELAYNDESMGVVRAAVDREFDLPAFDIDCELKPVLNRKKKRR